MSAVAVTRTVVVPRGATFIERSSFRLAAAMTRWATARAERREDRRVAMLAAIQDEQTRKADPRATDHALAQMGMRLREEATLRQAQGAIQAQGERRLSQSSNSRAMISPEASCKTSQPASNSAIGRPSSQVSVQ